MSIYCANNSRFITSGTLKYIEEKLPNNFMRVHNSYLVNIDKISAIESNCIILNKKPIPVSRSNWKILNQRLDFI
ncbi:MAG: LytR/AlgR family response regulator transcription factor, partial [Bacteroidota bacterium]|jgi:DNA-binding LytR/AlgR family response regulator